jgi:hypothetical protein
MLALTANKTHSDGNYLMDHPTFSKQDLQQILAQGHTLETILEHIAIFKQGVSFTTLHSPCKVGHGITVLSERDLEQLAGLYDEAVASGRVTKFVPASGAATRMFQSLLTYSEAKDDTDNAAGQDVQRFVEHLQDFAFYDDLQTVISKDGYAITTLKTQRQYRELCDYLLKPQGLNYANLPKALLQFHRYPDHCRTPLEEHLVEAAAYAQDCHHVARVHLTVTPAHIEAVQTHIDAIRSRYEHTGVRYEITLSTQSPATDTIAVDLENQPFRDQDGHLLFRPGGHGALLANLQALDADIVFIKNIDNVVPDHLKETTYRYKRALGGYLVKLQNQLFAYLEQLATGVVDEALLGEMWTFAGQQLAIMPPAGLTNQPLHDQSRWLMEHFNRPLRVCGMVRNEGEPGGGPFWVEQADGTLSLQIVEASQVNMASPEQRAILAASTHFNPVDLVCGMRDYRGRPFHLAQYVDPTTAFISQKTYAGQPLKALELPGLWNGAMAHWHTVFVEVPLCTFNPVKTVLDLLRAEHQS